MSETKHTPEPWAMREADGLVAIAHSKGFILEDDDDRQNIIDARRIVACVNFCKGLSTENMENDTLEDSLKEVLERTKSQRDELLAALTHAATDYIDQNGSVPSWWTDKIRQMVKPHA